VTTFSSHQLPQPLLFEVQDCHDCPFIYSDGNESRCALQDNINGDGGGLLRDPPGWCPIAKHGFVQASRSAGQWRRKGRFCADCARFDDCHHPQTPDREVWHAVVGCDRWKERDDER
jgi:hypothetical protein